MNRIGLLGIVVGSAIMVAGPPAAAQDWEYKITPYAWMAGLDGNIGAVPGYPAQEVSLSFGDVWDDLDFAGFVIGTARKGPWFVLLDASVVQTTANETVKVVNVDKYQIKTRSSFLELAVGRTLTTGPRYNIDGYFGARVVDRQ